MLSVSPNRLQHGRHNRSRASYSKTPSVSPPSNLQVLQPFIPPSALGHNFSTIPFTPIEQLLNPVENVTNQPENPFARLIPDQKVAIVPSFTLESGFILLNVPVAYTTRGRLSKNRDNALVICHALSGSADVADWWGPLMGASGQAFDASRFFIVCLNSLGSPYGSASPVTSQNGNVRDGRYGPEFPLTTIRDDVK